MNSMNQTLNFHLVIWCSVEGSRSLILKQQVTGCKLTITSTGVSSSVEPRYWRIGTLMHFLSSRLFKITQGFHTLECQCCAKPWFSLSVNTSLECYASCQHALFYGISCSVWSFSLSFLPPKIYGCHFNFSPIGVKSFELLTGNLARQLRFLFW